jgi:hypothetical protein
MEEMEEAEEMDSRFLILDFQSIIIQLVNSFNHPSMKLLASTRKGLVIFNKSNGRWQQESLHFKGIPVCLSYYNPRNETLWAFQDHGHWGIKISQSKDFGKTWKEVA